MTLMETPHIMILCIIKAACSIRLQFERGVHSWDSEFGTQSVYGVDYRGGFIPKVQWRAPQGVA